MKKLVIFDFDGTLVDSVGGLAAAVNFTLKAQGFETHSTDKVRSFIGNGILSLLQKSLPKNMRQTETLEKTRDIFLKYYDAHNTDFTEPYSGITQMLESLQSKGVKLAVASNKYHSATVAMVAHFFPTINFDAVIGQRQGVAVKPDATIVFDVLKECEIADSSDALYVGDSGVDMQTAKNADMDACAVSWGFSPREELENYNPKYIIDSAEQLLAIF